MSTLKPKTMKKDKCYWLVKSDPESYSWSDLLKDKSTNWDGVRNYQARNNLRAMKKGAQVLFYHSQTDKAVMGLAKVSEESFSDQTTNDERWLAVKLDVKNTFKKPVTLELIKSNKKLTNIALIKQSRLSVMPVTKDDFDEILRLAQ